MSVWQASHDEFVAKGASLTAIAPQAPEVCSRIRVDEGLSFEVLSDPDHVVLERYGLGFELDEQVRQQFLDRGYDLAELGEADHWWVPTPATLIVDTEQLIVFSDINADYRQRTDPESILAQFG